VKTGSVSALVRDEQRTKRNGGAHGLRKKYGDWEEFEANELGKHLVREDRLEPRYVVQRV
jgi:hypothetical protein